MVVRPLFSGRTIRSGSIHTLGVRADRRLGCVDITDRVGAIVESSGIPEGACVVYCAHTTSAVVINEWENGILEDTARALERLIPTNVYYAHDDMRRRSQNRQENEPPNGAAHIAQLLLGGTSQVVPISRGGLLMGRWQRIIFIDLDEPKERTLHVQLVPALSPGKPGS